MAINRSILNKGNFRMLINRLPNVEYYVKAVNLPGFQFSEVTAGTGIGIDAFFPGDKVEFETLRVTFLVDEDLANFIEIFEWMDAIVPFRNPSDYAKLVDSNQKAGDPYGKASSPLSQYSDATLAITTNKNTPNKYFKFRDIFPISISGIEFESGAETETISVEVEFRFSYYDIE